MMTNIFFYRNFIQFQISSNFILELTSYFRNEDWKFDDEGIFVWDVCIETRGLKMMTNFYKYLLLSKFYSISNFLEFHHHFFLNHRTCICLFESFWFRAKKLELSLITRRPRTFAFANNGEVRGRLRHRVSLHPLSLYSSRDATWRISFRTSPRLPSLPLLPSFLPSFLPSLPPTYGGKITQQRDKSDASVTSLRGSPKPPPPDFHGRQGTEIKLLRVYS